MPVRPKDDKCALYCTVDLPPFISNNEKGKGKCLFFPYSIWNGVWPKRYTYHFACEAKRRQMRFISLIYLHAHRIRKNEKGYVSYFLFRYEMALDRKIYTIRLARPKDDKGAICHALRIRKKEMSTFSLFDIKWRWTEKHVPLCLWGQKTTKALYTIDLSTCISNKDKCKRKYFLFTYSQWNGIWQNIFSIMLVRPKDDKWALYCTTDLPPFSSNKEKGKGKCLLFPHSIWNGVGPKKYIILLVKPNDDKRALYHWSTAMHFE